MKKLFFAFALLLVVSSVVNAQTWVNGYVRNDGTQVSEHWRSSPNGNPYDNWSYPGNTNPYTGKVAQGNRDTYLQNYYGTSLSYSKSGLNTNSIWYSELKSGSSGYNNPYSNYYFYSNGR